MPLITLTPNQHLRLHTALLAAFPNRQSLSALLLAIGQNYDQLEVANYNFKDNVHAVIQEAQQYDWLLL